MKAGPMRRSISCALLIAVAAAVVACGDDSDEAGPSRAEYLTRTDAICGVFKQEARSILVPLSDELESGELTPEQLEPLLDRYKALIERLRDVEPPAADAEAVGTILDAYDETHDRYKEDPISAIDPDDVTPVDSAQEEAGFEICSA